MAHTPHRRVILDMDSSESPVHGQQEGAAYNGHFECVCYHPLFLFNQFGDCEGATLRSGNVSSADGWQELLEPVVKGYQKKGLRLLFRGDAAFAKPELYEYLEEEKTGYAIRLPANQVVQEQIQPLLEPPTEWPSREPMVSYHDFAYQAQSWRLPRRVVAKVEWHRGELFPSHVASQHVPYAMLLYERYLGRPFATHRDAVSEQVGDVMETAIEEHLARARIVFRKTKLAERVPGYDQAPDFFVPDEFNPSVLIEAKITGLYPDSLQ